MTVMARILLQLNLFVQIYTAVTFNKTVLKNDANRLKPGMKLVIPALKQAPAR